MDLVGRVALVTGAAHRVGRAIALELARSGSDLVVHFGRSAEAALATADEITALGVQALRVPADLSRPEEIDCLFAAVTDRFGRLDVLVNSAASFRRQRFDAISAADWDAVLALNLRAPFLCSQRAARLMRATDRPPDQPALIVNIADLSGVQAWRDYAHHSVSKAGLLQLTRLAARELAPDIRVNAVVPGPILPPPGLDADSDAWRRLGEAVPLRRTGDPAHIGRAVVYLAMSDFVTGVTLSVDGGEHLVGPYGR